MIAGTPAERRSAVVKGGAGAVRTLRIGSAGRRLRPVPPCTRATERRRQRLVTSRKPIPYLQLWQQQLSFV